VTNLESKYRAESSAYEQTDSFDATPMAGPGRWSVIGGTVLYTNDSNVLFADGETDLATHFYKEMDAAFTAGKTATETFDLLRGNADVVSGDLSEIE